jgi:hypothetical protein
VAEKVSQSGILNFSAVLVVGLLLVVGLPEHPGHALGGFAGNLGIGCRGRVVAVRGLKFATAAATAPPWPT